MTDATIAVIGAGFSGTLLALHILKRCPPFVRVALIERNSHFGRGAAYATGNPGHLLNVPAGNMSAFHERPGDFLDWLREHAPAEQGCAPPTASCFISRLRYGQYVRHLLEEEIRKPQSADRLDLVRGDVQRLDESDDELTLTLDRGRFLRADVAVLAIGNFPPEPPPVADPGFYDTELYRPDPWSPDALADLDPAAPVLLIGTGLTTVDAVISLLDQGHTGPIHALSRRGLLPHRHHTGPRLPARQRSFPTSLNGLVRALRQDAEQAEAEGGTWHPTVDALRPYMVDVWQTMSVADRARFLRHLRPWWDVHRHRIAPLVADRINEARRRGQFLTRAGRVRRYDRVGDRVDVTFRARGTDRLETIRAARVVNCSGPCCDYDRIPDALVRSLLADGLARPDRLRLGLDVTATCALLGRDGAISRRLLAVGPVTRGAFWEMTAVPDIRRQCEVMAGQLAVLLQRAPVPVPAAAWIPYL